MKRQGRKEMARAGKSVLPEGYQLPWPSDPEERDLLLYLLHLTPPASLDDLSTLGRMPAVKVLHLMDRLKRRRLVLERKDYGKGFYFLFDRETVTAAEGYVSGERANRVLTSVFDFYRDTLAEGPEKTLILAELYRKRGKISEGLQCIREAADLLVDSGEKAKAALYYDCLLDHLGRHGGSTADLSALIDTIVKNMPQVIQVLPLDGQLSLLTKAEAVLERYERWADLVRAKLLLGRVLGRAGEREGSARYVDESWKIAELIGDRSLSRLAALAVCDSLFLEGRFADAVERYEKVVGKLEEFGDDEASLKAVASLGRCYVVCGRISRGMGMIEAGRSKAAALSFKDVVVYSNLMSILSLMEVRRTDEAEVRLKALLTMPEKDLDTYALSSAFGCMAFIHESKGEHDRAREYRDRMAEQKGRPGWMSPRGSHLLEFLDQLESGGCFSETLNLSGEIARILGSDDIYMRGIACRQRASHNLKALHSMGRAFLDLKNSERYLQMAGAEIELARTRIVLGDAYLREGGMRAALSYLNQAWSVLSTIDENLFPKDLRVVLMPEEHRTELMIERIISVSASVEMRQDIPTFLERVINVVMDFSLAMRGAIFVDEGDEPRIAASRNLDPKLLKADQFSLILKVVSEVARTGKEIVIPASGERSRFDEASLAAAGISSVICMPARIGGRTHGYLYLDSQPGGQTLPEDHLPYLRLLCNQVAVGFSAMALFEKMKELKDRFEDEASFYKREMGISNPEKSIIGQSEAVRVVVGQIRQVAPTDSSVLITGETGVGKELVAMAIHNGSRRKDGPFIPVNLAALPQELVASELFGHEKGAFTGANERHKGRFELAHGGTIFLDEIGDLPPSIQVKLLRVLQEGIFERLGSAEPVRSDFRVVAATNKDLVKEVSDGTFRRDLYYRLNAFPIFVPPLRARKEDIILLAKHFADRFGKKTGRGMERIPLAEVRKLLPYEWPGNVRELKHFVERSVILSEGTRVSFTAPDQGIERVVAGDDTTIIPLADMERRYIEKALTSTHWKVSGVDGAAALLRIKPTTLLSRMKKLGVAKPGKSPK
jgi:transcriptional regulator with GAF, ATPase, and Fis domain/tetratricopeptide (TPR) repeat protein